MFIRSRNFLRLPHSTSRRRSMSFLGRLAVGSCVSFLLVDAACATISVGPPGACTFSTVQAAINAAAATDTITVSGGATYAENLVVNNKSLTISSCPCNPTVCTADRINGTLQNAIISGANATTPVLRVTGTSNVTLSHLTIQDGHTGSTDGGGISFTGVGALSMSDSIVIGNTANYGAGIDFNPASDGSTLTLGPNTTISDNTAAVSGGGVRMERGTLYAQSKNTWIALNKAKTGYGGGIEIAGSNVPIVYLSSPGYLGLPVVYENEAMMGGGIGISNSGVLVLYSSDGTQPVAIGDNTAYATGGGIHVDTALANGSVICARDFRIDNNIAKDGTALYSNTNSNGGAAYIELNQHDPTTSCGAYPPPNFPVACAAGVACSTMHGNVAQDVNNANVGTDGATISLMAGTTMFANNLDIRDNQGGYAIYEHGNNINAGLYTVGFLQTCLITDNVFNNEVALAQGPGTAHLTLTNCTLANNNFGGASIVGANDYVNLSYDILDQNAPALAFSGAGSNLHTQYNIARDISGLSASDNNLTATPTFIDAAHGDYRLLYTKQGATYTASAGLDFAPAEGGTDIRGDAYDFELGSVNDTFGPRDLGAYEMQAYTDRIFVDALGDAVQIAF